MFQPDNATYLGPAVFGYGTEFLDIHAWEFTIPQTDLLVKLAVSADGCVPIVEAMYGHVGDGGYMGLWPYGREWVYGFMAIWEKVGIWTYGYMGMCGYVDVWPYGSVWVCGRMAIGECVGMCCLLYTSPSPRDFG